MSLPKLYTANEAAEYLRISARTVRDYCKSGRIHGAKVTGKHWLIPEESLIAYVTPVETEATPAKRRAVKRQTFKHLNFD
jgi:excisionase family DNA binding protein